MKSIRKSKMMTFMKHFTYDFFLKVLGLIEARMLKYHLLFEQVVHQTTLSIKVANHFEEVMKQADAEYKFQKYIEAKEREKED